MNRKGGKKRKKKKELESDGTPWGVVEEGRRLGWVNIYVYVCACVLAEVRDWNLLDVSLVATNPVSFAAVRVVKEFENY